MKVKKTLIIFVVLIMMMALSGCTNNAEDGQVQDGTQAGVTEQAHTAEPVHPSTTLEEKPPYNETEEVNVHGEALEKSEEASKETGYTLPGDWNYQFATPEIGSFKGYEDGAADATDMENGSAYGFDDWLAQGCSTWCGCLEFYSETKASSTLPQQGNVSYDAAHLSEMTRESVWSEGVPGDGVGETIEIIQLYQGTGDDIFCYSQICIVNGYAESEKKWQENNRVKSLKFYFEDEYMGMITLEDTMKPQYIDVTPVKMTVGNGCEAKFRFEIAEVYNGTLYDDTCLTGIILEFDGRHAH